MNKITLISIILVLLFLTSINSADAALFNWKTRFTSNELAANIGTDWTFVKVANRSADVKANITEVMVDKPVERKFQVSKTYLVRATAYSSTADQTDSTPFVTASGTYVRDGIIATNFLPFGTQIRMPDLYGDKIFVVEDRMNKRYWHNIDIWFPERQLAREFGVKTITIEVVTEESES